MSLFLQPFLLSLFLKHPSSRPSCLCCVCCLFVYSGTSDQYAQLLFALRGKCSVTFLLFCSGNLIYFAAFFFVFVFYFCFLFNYFFYLFSPPVLKSQKMILIKFVSFYRSYTNQQRTRVKLDCPWQGFKNCFEFEATHIWALITYLVHKRELELSPYWT